MKKTLSCLALLALLASPFQAGAADGGRNPAGNPVDQLTGKYWLGSKPENQKAYLFGIESAIAVEKSIQDLQSEKKLKSSGKQIYTLSPFEKGWMEAFKDVSREQIAEEVTKWYKENPDQEDRPVLSVIWHQLISPRLKEGK